MSTWLFTSESVTCGHPDKICDQISDALLDIIIEQDPMARVACETLASTNLVLVTGEFTTNARPDIAKVVKDKVKEIGYLEHKLGFYYKDLAILTFLKEQSPELSRVIEKRRAPCDQGIMFGYATKETGNRMPLPISLAHELTYMLDKLRKSGEINYLRPDGKSQVTIEYERGTPKRIHTVLIATQHDPEVSLEQLRHDVMDKAISPVCKEYVDEKTIYHINTAGSFTIGGPACGTGYTGKKLMVDTYGGFARHGGGALSGKDCSKMDRTGTYMARYLAKNIVEAGLAEKCEVEIAYGAGVPEPISILVNTFDTGRIPESKISKMIKEKLNLDIDSIIEKLDLRKPIYSKTSVYGHFGKNELSWEQTDLFN